MGHHAIAMHLSTGSQNLHNAQLMLRILRESLKTFQLTKMFYTFVHTDVAPYSTVYILYNYL